MRIYERIRYIVTTCSTQKRCVLYELRLTVKRLFATQLDLISGKSLEFLDTPPDLKFAKYVL